jgi:hypothetical protein
VGRAQTRHLGDNAIFGAKQLSGLHCADFAIAPASCIKGPALYWQRRKSPVSQQAQFNSLWQEALIPFIFFFPS